MGAQSWLFGIGGLALAISPWLAPTWLTLIAGALILIGAFSK